jgi:hypothetical protein
VVSEHPHQQPLYRLTVRETTGAASAQFDIYDGSGTNSILVASIGLTAGSTYDQWWDPWVFPYDAGLYLNVVSGTIKGGLTVLHVDKGETKAKQVVMVNPEVFQVTIPT